MLCRQAGGYSSINPFVIPPSLAGFRRFVALGIGADKRYSRSPSLLLTNFSTYPSQDLIIIWPAHHLASRLVLMYLIAQYSLLPLRTDYQHMLYMTSNFFC